MQYSQDHRDSDLDFTSGDHVPIELLPIQCHPSFTTVLRSEHAESTTEPIMQQYDSE